MTRIQAVAALQAKSASGAMECIACGCEVHRAELFELRGKLRERDGQLQDALIGAAELRTTLEVSGRLLSGAMFFNKRATAKKHALLARIFQALAGVATGTEVLHAIRDVLDLVAKAPAQDQVAQHIVGRLSPWSAAAGEVPDRDEKQWWEYGRRAR